MSDLTRCDGRSRRPVRRELTGLAVALGTTAWAGTVRLADSGPRTNPTASADVFHDSLSAVRPRLRPAGEDGYDLWLRYHPRRVSPNTVRQSAASSSTARRRREGGRCIDLRPWSGMPTMNIPTYID